MSWLPSNCVLALVVVPHCVLAPGTTSLQLLSVGGVRTPSLTAWGSLGFSCTTQEIGNPFLGPCPIFDFPAGAVPARCEGRRRAAAGLLCVSPTVTTPHRAGACDELFSFYKEQADGKFQRSPRTVDFIWVVFWVFSGLTLHVLCCCLEP